MNDRIEGAVEKYLKAVSRLREMSLDDRQLQALYSTIRGQYLVPKGYRPLLGGERLIWGSTHRGYGDFVAGLSSDDVDYLHFYLDSTGESSRESIDMLESVGLEVLGSGYFFQKKGHDEYEQGRNQAWQA